MNKITKHGLSDFADEVGRCGMLLDTNVEDNTPVTGLTQHSELAEPGTLFVCRGADFTKEQLQDALNRGAIGYISEKPYEVTKPGAHSFDERPNAILVKDIGETMNILESMFYETM